MEIKKNTVASLSYELEVEGAIVDKAGSEKPLEYIHGTGMLLPRFEEEVEGKTEGETFEFTLSAEEGYGEYDERYKVTLPKSTFEVDGKLMEELLVVGRPLPMLNSAGQVVQGTVAEIPPDSVVMDFNHPMAGKTLHFTGRVEKVREATEKELLEGLHGEYLPQGGCHCGEGGCHCGEGECNCGEGECGCGEGECGCGEGEGGCHCGK